ncbi:hypothetical protein BBZ05_07420 [Campylobacter lari]|nr:hypothetical protein [Campylobacter lari]MCV3371753.1 hypothetical protein [Campylobacter lari]
MFLEFIGYVFTFVVLHLMIVFLVKSHIAVIKTSFQGFDLRFILVYNSGLIIAEYLTFLAYSKYILN